MHRLRVTAGPSLEEMVQISPNTSQAHSITSELFDGQISAYIKGFTDGEGKVLDHEYFDREDRQGITWSIQVRGRFLVPYNADDILFGNTFVRPLKLPWGTSAVLRFMNYIDPTLEHDLQSQSKPWALSPLIATMPHFTHERVRASEKQFPPPKSLIDDTSQLYLAATSPVVKSSGSCTSRSSSESSLQSPQNMDLQPPKRDLMKVKHRSAKATDIPEFKSAAQRRSYFSSAEARQNITFGPLDIITTDFCYGFINFNPSLSLQLPGGLSFDLAKYWDGQPIRFVCCERRRPGSAEPWGRIFWCISIETVTEELDSSNIG